MTVKRRTTDYDRACGRDAPDGAASLQQFVSFSAGGQEYCADIMAVREIRAWTGITSLPNSPAHIRGVINLRGTIVPVIDLRQRFGQGATVPEAGSVVIIVAVGNTHAGLLVDAVSDIVTADARDIATVPVLEGGAGNPFFRGLITLNGKLMALVALEHLIAQRTAEPAAA